MAEVCDKELIKKTFVGDSASEVAQIDLLCADLLVQIESLMEEQSEEVRVMRTLALKQYVKGYRDGFRLFKPNPYKDLVENKVSL